MKCFVQYCNSHLCLKVWEQAEEFIPERFDLEGPVPNESNTDFRYTFYLCVELHYVKSRIGTYQALIDMVSASCLTSSKSFSSRQVANTRANIARMVAFEYLGATDTLTLSGRKQKPSFLTFYRSNISDALSPLIFRWSPSIYLQLESNQQPPFFLLPAYQFPRNPLPLLAVPESGHPITEVFIPPLPFTCSAPLP